MNTGELVNKSIEYDTDLFDLMQNWFNSEGKHKHNDATRNRNLMERIDRRLTANTSNRRLNHRIHAGEVNVWRNKTMYQIDMAKIHSLFSINALL